MNVILAIRNVSELPQRRMAERSGSWNCTQALAVQDSGGYGTEIGQVISGFRRLETLVRMMTGIRLESASKARAISHHLGHRLALALAIFTVAFNRQDRESQSL